MAIPTAGYLNPKNNPGGANDWSDFLKSGSSCTLLDTAKLAGADTSTVQLLRDTIRFLNDTADQITAYTKELSHG